MKLRYYVLFFLIPLLFIKDEVPFYNQSEFFPVLMQRTDLEKSVFYRNAQTINEVGKLYYKDNFIFLNEKFKGIHVIDNSNPSSPENVGFINIPGCIDIAIKRNTLYADNAVDLVAIDLSGNLSALNVTERVKNVFPEPTPPDLDFIPYNFSISERPEGTIIVGWERISDIE